MGTSWTLLGPFLSLSWGRLRSAVVPVLESSWTPEINVRGRASPDIDSSRHPGAVLGHLKSSQGPLRFSGHSLPYLRDILGSCGRLKAVSDSLKINVRGGPLLTFMSVGIVVLSLAIPRPLLGPYWAVVSIPGGAFGSSPGVFCKQKNTKTWGSTAYRKQQNTRLLVRRRMTLSARFSAHVCLFYI